jgi:hypothetical protein
MTNAKQLDSHIQFDVDDGGGGGGGGVGVGVGALTALAGKVRAS